MLFFENKKVNNVRTIKFLNSVIYRTKKTTKKRIQRIFKDAIVKIKSERENKIIKKTYFLGKELLKTVKTREYQKDYLLNFEIKKIDFRKIFIKKIPKEYQHFENFLILSANSGEIYLFLTYFLDKFLEKNNCKDILLIATKKYHQDMIDLICPEIPNVLINSAGYFGDIKMCFENKNIFSIFPNNHFLDTEEKIKKSPLHSFHYFDAICEKLSIKRGETSYRNIKTTNEIMESVIKKVADINLNIDNFIFIAPEATSSKEYSLNFWSEIADNLTQKGFDVYFNITNHDTFKENNFIKHCDLNFKEAFALASISKGIISLRSGLVEVFLQTNKYIFCLYTDFKNNMSSEYVFSGFELKKLPHVNLNLIEEVDTSKIQELECKNKIIERITKYTEGKI